MAQSTVRRRKTSASRRVELLEMAANIFLEKGYKETGIEVILNQAGLTGPALYRHFSSKQEILDTICLEAGRRAVEIGRFALSEPGLTARERMETLIRLRLDHLFGENGVGSFLAVLHPAHISAAAQAQMLDMQAEFGAAFASLLHELRPSLSEGECRMTFFVIQNMVLFGIWRSRSRGLLSDAEYREVLEEMIWNTMEV